MFVALHSGRLRPYSQTLDLAEKVCQAQALGHFGNYGGKKVLWYWSLSAKSRGLLAGLRLVVGQHVGGLQPLGVVVQQRTLLVEAVRAGDWVSLAFLDGLKFSEQGKKDIKYKIIFFLSFWLFVCLSVCLSIYLSSIYLSVSFLFVHPSFFVYVPALSVCFSQRYQTSTETWYSPSHLRHRNGYYLI